jgi:hypothetical protein
MGLNMVGWEEAVEHADECKGFELASCNARVRRRPANGDLEQEENGPVADEIPMMGETGVEFGERLRVRGLVERVPMLRRVALVISNVGGNQIPFASVAHRREGDSPDDGFRHSEAVLKVMSAFLANAHGSVELDVIRGKHGPLGREGCGTVIEEGSFERRNQSWSGSVASLAGLEQRTMTAPVRGVMRRIVQTETVGEVPDGGKVVNERSPVGLR